MADLDTMRTIIQADHNLTEPVAALQKAYQDFHTFNDDMYEKYHDQAQVIELTELENNSWIMDEKTFDNKQRELSTSLPGDLNVDAFFTKDENETGIKVLEAFRNTYMDALNVIKPIVIENGFDDVSSNAHPHSPATLMAHELTKLLEAGNLNLAQPPAVEPVSSLTAG